MKKKILYILTRSPDPATDGTRERILGELKSLSQDFEVSVLLITEEKINQEQQKNLEGHISGEVFVYQLSKIGCYVRSLMGLFSHYPVQTNYYYSKGAQKWIEHHGKEYAVLHFHTIRLGKYIQYLKKNNVLPHVRILLCFNDSIALGYSEAVKTAKGLWKLIYSVELPRIKKYEVDILNFTHESSVVSERDKEYILHTWKEKNPESTPPSILVLKHSIDDDYFDYTYNPKTSNLVCMGNMFYPPNHQGMNVFCEKILPLLREKDPTIKLLIIGKGGKEFFSHTEGVETFGFLENPYDMICDQALFINPALFGAGVPTKALVAMALGLPVVSTKSNAMGIRDLIEGENISLIDYQKIDEAVNKILELINDENTRKRIGASGREFVSKNYRKTFTDKELILFIEKNT